MPIPIPGKQIRFDTLAHREWVGFSGCQKIVFIKTRLLTAVSRHGVSDRVALQTLPFDIGSEFTDAFQLPRLCRCMRCYSVSFPSAIFSTLTNMYRRTAPPIYAQYIAVYQQDIVY